MAIKLYTHSFPFSIEQFNKVFDELLENSSKNIGIEKYPPSKLIETENSHILEYALAGWKKEDIVIDVEQNVLTISGEKKEKEEKKEIYSTMAFRKFEQSKKLLEYHDTNNIEAEMKDGILKIEIPFKENATKKLIDIK